MVKFSSIIQKNNVAPKTMLKRLIFELVGGGWVGRQILSLKELKRSNDFSKMGLGSLR